MDKNFGSGSDMAVSDGMADADMRRDDDDRRGGSDDDRRGGSGDDMRGDMQFGGSSMTLEMDDSDSMRL